jgi:hypothetical protein
VGKWQWRANNIAMVVVGFRSRQSASRIAGTSAPTTTQRSLSSSVNTTTTSDFIIKFLGSCFTFLVVIARGTASAKAGLSWDERATAAVQPLSPSP